MCPFQQQNNAVAVSFPIVLIRRLLFGDLLFWWHVRRTVEKCNALAVSVVVLVLLAHYYGGCHMCITVEHSNSLAVIVEVVVFMLECKAVTVALYPMFFNGTLLRGAPRVPYSATQ